MESDKMNQEDNLENDNGFIKLKTGIKFRPKARLLSILGEQLISNDVVAIKELVLNAYDADAENVYINFLKNESGIVNCLEILDDGNGMTEERLINGWFTPATDLKTNAKKSHRSEIFNRQILGEKGIGRFACKRLGEILELRSKPQDTNKEMLIKIKWEDYDADGQNTYLDEIENTIYCRDSSIDMEPSITKSLSNLEKGTSIKIFGVRLDWNQKKIEELELELLKLIPPFHKIGHFTILINNRELKNDIFLEKALYYIEGIVDKQGQLYYILGDYPRNIKLRPGLFFENINFNENIGTQLDLKEIEWYKADLLKQNAWSDYTKKLNVIGIEHNGEPNCGNFTFAAYAWNLDPVHTKRVGINDKKSRSLLKSLSGISIYRDGFRVWPYGSSGNDWLELDKRAEGGQKPFHIANKQVIGYVNITHEGNSNLRDTSNREGIIEEGNNFSDFKTLVTLAFSFIEKYRYKNSQKERPRKDKEYWSQDKVLDELDKLSKLVEEKAPILSNEFGKFKGIYKARKIETETKITNLLEVSSSGVVFESVTHELISFLNKMDDQSKAINNSLNENPIDFNTALQSNILLKEALNIVLYEIKELQPFFKAARYELKELDMKDIVRKSMLYYEYKLKRNKITYEVIEATPMKKKAVEGFLLQIFTNLIDNSIYWLNSEDNISRMIKIIIDGDKNIIYFCDNGKGIQDESKPFVFDAFFTEKAPGEGRGLGLYITQELLANYRGSIAVCDDYKPFEAAGKDKGVTFKISIL